MGICERSACEPTVQIQVPENSAPLPWGQKEPHLLQCLPPDFEPWTQWVIFNHPTNLHKLNYVVLAQS